MSVERSDLIFHFGAYGKTPLVLFHPSKTIAWQTPARLFIPRSGCEDVSIYEEFITGLIATCPAPVYALEFRSDETAEIRQPTGQAEHDLISGALLWLRQEQLHVITCSLATEMFVFGHPHFRRGHDVVERLRH